MKISKRVKRFQFWLAGGPELGTSFVQISGPFGKLSVHINFTEYVALSSNSSNFIFYSPCAAHFYRLRSNIFKAIKDVCYGYHVQIFLRGIGLRAFRVRNSNTMGLELGFSHFVFFPSPPLRSVFD